MSWQVPAYVIIAIVLFGGFAWYERSRPPSQIVALVAAMAALAVAGRIAFPVLPNVVATTDIVLFTGYAIGAAPGFVVGALAALVSNFWLGQGPWTPWQMAGWGLVGIAGAALATLTGRRLNRFGLAAACGIAGLLFGALLDFSLMVTYGGEQSFDRYLALSARGVPFNIAHATGNVVIALVAGPALVRMLLRFRQRFEVTWSPRPAMLLVAAALSLALAVPGGEAKGAGRGSAAAVSWLHGVQNPDGGFGPGPGDESDPSMTGWVSLGLEAAGVNPLDFAKGGKSPISYLRANASGVRGTGDIERTILVLRGAGLGARGFGGRDLVADLRALRDADGSFSGQVNLTAFGVMALEAAGSHGGNTRSAVWIAGAQNPDGGWGFAPRTQGDADSTGAAMQALAAAGGNSAALSKGVSFLRSVQRPGGGFPLYNGAVNSQSTAWGVQGLAAQGTSPDALRKGGTPLGYLARVQEADGHYRYSPSSDQTPVWVTGQVLLAVNRKPFPIAAVARDRAAGAPAGSQNRAAVAGGTPAPLGAKQVPTGAGASPAATAALPVATPSADSAPILPAKADDGTSPLSAALIAAGAVPAACGLAALGWLLYRRRLPG